MIDFIKRTGLRVSEVARLRVGDIDFLRGHGIVISATMTSACRLATSEPRRDMPTHAFDDDSLVQNPINDFRNYPLTSCKFYAIV